MAEEPKEPETPREDSSTPDDHSRSNEHPAEEPALPAPSSDPALTPTSDVYSSSSDPYGQLEAIPEQAKAEEITGYLPPQEVAKIPPKSPPPPPNDDDDEGDDEEKGMLRMSFMEHLEELRSRLLRAIGGLIVAFLLAIGFCKEIWSIVAAPAVTALTNLGFDPNLAQITPMEQFNVIYFKLPLLVGLFLASPWIVYQVWAFISPGLYKRERRWAVPFVLSTAGLFISGGCFAYFVAFRFGLEFQLGYKKLGRKRWNKEVERAISQIESLFNFDHLYIGGGNATKIDFPLPRHVTRVPNEDGLLGGVALWRDFDSNATLRGETPLAAREKAT